MTPPSAGRGAHSTAPVGFLDPDDHFTRQFIERPFFRENLDRIDQYDLPETDLGRFAGLVVSSQADQDLLHDRRGQVRDYLDDGGAIAFSGHLSREWLPAAGTFVPKRIESHDDYVVERVRPHPVLEGVEMDDLTYQRGVAGFFARGHNPPPDGATVLLALPGGEAIVWVDAATTAGTVLVHSGNDLVGLARRDTTAARVPTQLMTWLRDVSEGPGVGR
jgi:hypothetical protein